MVEYFRNVLLTLLVVFFATVISPWCYSQNAPETTDEYPMELHDPNCNFLVGKVVEVLFPPDEHERIQVTVAGDMRGTFRPGMNVTVVGPPTGIVSGGSYTLDVKVGEWGVFLVRPLKDSIAFENVHINFFPFAVNPANPSVPARDIPLITAALRELKIHLSAPHGSGMPKDRARALIGSSNSYLWSLGCWSLAKDGDIDDVRKLASLFTAEITPRQALFLDDVFDHVTGNATSSVPSIDDRRRNFRMILAKYVQDAAAPQTQPSDGTKLRKDK